MQAHDRGPASDHHTGPGSSPLPVGDLMLWPTLAFLYLYGALHWGELDRLVVGLFVTPDMHSFPLRHDFWTEHVLHDGAQSVLKGVLAAVSLLWLCSLFVPRLVAWRRVLSYLMLAITLSVGAVHLGKRWSNMDCPWDLQEFGGTRPYYGLFEAKPADAPPGRCFPGGHSSSGFALFCLFFAARRTGVRRAGWLLLMPLLLGAAFAADQWIRGAHFPSHDVTTAYLCWMIALTTDAWMYRRRAPA